jgi:hypothetical protein
MRHAMAQVLSLLTLLLLGFGQATGQHSKERIPRIGYLPSAGAPLPRQLKSIAGGAARLESP